MQENTKLSYKNAGLWTVEKTVYSSIAYVRNGTAERIVHYDSDGPIDPDWRVLTDEQVAVRMAAKILGVGPTVASMAMGYGMGGEDEDEDEDEAPVMKLRQYRETEPEPAGIPQEMVDFPPQQEDLIIPYVETRPGLYLNISISNRTLEEQIRAGEVVAVNGPHKDATAAFLAEIKAGLGPVPSPEYVPQKVFKWSEHRTHSEYTAGCHFCYALAKP